MLNIFLDGQPIEGLVDMGAVTTVLTENEGLHCPHAKSNQSANQQGGRRRMRLKNDHPSSTLEGFGWKYRYHSTYYSQYTP